MESSQSKVHPVQSDSQYHNIATNVNALLQRAGKMALGGNKGSLGEKVGVASRTNAQHDAARNLSPAQPLKDLVCLRQGLRKHFAVNFPGCSQGENLLQILSRAD